MWCDDAGGSEMGEKEKRERESLLTKSCRVSSFWSVFFYFFLSSIDRKTKLYSFLVLRSNDGLSLPPGARAGGPRLAIVDVISKLLRVRRELQRAGRRRSKQH
jgi:hypothetical protein